jgi:hypothetical protein
LSGEEGDGKMGMGMLIWIFDYWYWEDSLDHDILIVIDYFENIIRIKQTRKSSIMPQTD